MRGSIIKKLDSCCRLKLTENKNLLTFKIICQKHLNINFSDEK